MCARLWMCLPGTRDRIVLIVPDDLPTSSWYLIWVVSRSSMPSLRIWLLHSNLINLEWFPVWVQIHSLPKGTRTMNTLQPRTEACKQLFVCSRVMEHWEFDNTSDSSYKSTHHVKCCTKILRMSGPIKPAHRHLLIQKKHFCCGGEKKKICTHISTRYNNFVQMLLKLGELLLHKESSILQS